MREAPIRLAALVLALGIAAAAATIGCGHRSDGPGSAASADFAGTTLDPPQMAADVRAALRAADSP